MRAQRVIRAGSILLLAAVVIAGSVAAFRATGPVNRTRIVAYFANGNGIYVGDEVRILGVRVGRVDLIEPQPQQVKIEFSLDGRHKIPAEAKAAILSPTLVSARALQLIPAYTSGPVMANNAVIPISRTVVPVEWDDVRSQLQRLSETLQPTLTGGVSTLGALVNTAADNLRGQGDNIRDAVINLSQTLSILGDRSSDVFGTVRNLSVLVSALHDSAALLGRLNQNLSAVTALLANSPNEIGAAVRDFNQAAHDVADFVAANRATVGVTSDKLSSLSQAVMESLDDIKQTLHVMPNTVANFNNTYDPAQGSVTSVMAVSNFANPIQFICGGIQAASRLNAEHAAKLCVQYLAPIIKNRQYNFPPIGTTIGLAAPIPVVGATVRPNEITYSEDWMRPDYVPTQPSQESPLPPSAPEPSILPPLPAEGEGPLAVPATAGASAVPINPQHGLTGMMVPSGTGS